ncbi:anti-sigma factor domain-containing protein [Aneurinibacillus thermoaerophilus]|uniref:Anti-sigma factor domain-containing protein n=1 Tax=Aneurinibacillus thermoaerophilus TaxID=143495 RepID=A0ABX8Y9V0_ANETH|nr:anti-sigma factor domain-containing protein [Aneurinibacillus thermoaerophilus]QYY42292.1 anti-sigma factor domain-containing protein [Aneurinibacillus thermoaerophilus]
MKRKGIVLEIQNQYLIVMTSDGEFCKIPPVDKPLTEGDEVEFTRTVKAEKASQRAKRSWKGWTYVAAACLLLFITALPLWNMVFASAYAAVSIDINPSFELEIDKNYVVTSVTALNQDAESILKNIKWEKRPLLEVTKDILTDARVHGFLKNNHDVLIVPVGLKNPEASRELLQLMKKEIPHLVSNSAGELTITLMESTKEMRKQAQKLGISPGKYTLYDSMKRVNKKISEKEIQTLSISEVSSAIGGFENIPNIIQYSKEKMAAKPEARRPAQVTKPVASNVKQRMATNHKANATKEEKKKHETTVVQREEESSAGKRQHILTEEEKRDKTKGVPKIIAAETKRKAEQQTKREANRTKEDERYYSEYGQLQQQYQQGGRAIKEEEKERNEKYKEEREKQKNKQNFSRPPINESEENKKPSSGKKAEEND